MKRFLAMLACLVPVQAAALDPVSPEDFRKMTQGWTVYFTLNGELYGAESYASGDRSCWCYFQGECQEGTWWADGPALCFDYGHEDGPSCWTLHKDEHSILARLIGDRRNAGLTLRFLKQDRKPLPCSAPVPLS